jgi:predicted XRE-type DNA-binding protein
MSDDADMIRGSGNVFRDLGHPDADREQLRALLAARIIGVLDERKLTVRAAQEITGVAAADFSRIRKANLGWFTIDRLMTILAGAWARGRGHGRDSPAPGGFAERRGPCWSSWSYWGGEPIAVDA